MKNKGLTAAWLLTTVATFFLLYHSGTIVSTADTAQLHEKVYSEEALRADLNQLVRVVVDKNPQYYTDRDELEEAIATAEASLHDGMTELQFYRAINPVVTALACGHTNLSISENLVENREGRVGFFPLETTLVEDRLFVLRADPEHGIEAGEEILMINGAPTEEIVATLLEGISSDGDNPAKRRYVLDRHFALKYHDLLDDSGRFTVYLKDLEGRFREVQLKGAYDPRSNETAWSLHFAETRGKANYAATLHDTHAVLDLNVFMEDKALPFDAFLEDFFKDVEAQGIDRLVIDLRGNYGGDPGMAKELLAYLIDGETTYLTGDFGPIYRLFGFGKPIAPKERYSFDGQVVVLVDGAVFSTSAHVAAFVKAHDLATLVGSETGGNQVCTDASRDVVLKETKIRCHYSTKVFALDVGPEEAGRGIRPDIPVERRLEDRIEGTDPIMDRALALLGIDGSE
jgi:C-terminal processing protease CtpA/Prc